MGQRGPLKKPEWLSVIDGNPSGKPLGRTLRSVPVQELDPPDYFNETQIKMWRNVCAVLAKVNALTIADQFVLARYVELLSEYRKAADFMSRHSEGNIVYPLKDKNGVTKSIRMLPQLKAMLEISSHLLRIEQHFGLTPSSRAAIMVNPPGGNNGGIDFDPFD